MLLYTDQNFCMIWVRLSRLHELERKWIYLHSTHGGNDLQIRLVLGST